MIKSATLGLIISSLSFCAFASSDNPGVFMDNGFEHMQFERWEEANKSFNKALASNYLRDSYRAVAYWNVHICNEKLNDEDKSMEALFGFIVYASLTMDGKDTYPDFKYWVRRYRISYKLSHALAMIQARWAKKNSYSCRSEEFACYVVEKYWIAVFKNELMSCKDNVIPMFKAYEKDNMFKVSVQCGSEVSNYYFTNKNEY